MRFCAIALPALSSFLLFHGVPWQDPQGRRSGDALAERAREEFREHKYQAAERDFRAITRRDPSNVYAQLFLGQCLFAQQKYVDASTSFEEARELEQKHAVLSLDQKRILGDQLAMAYGMAGQPKKARVVLEEAIRRDPDYALNYYNLACAFAELGERDRMLVNISLAFKHKEHMLQGEQLPDPRSDQSFQKYLQDKQFIKLMNELGFK